MSERASFRRLVEKIMNEMPEPDGGRASWVEAVLMHDGELAQHGDALMREALASIVGEILRTRRDPETGAHLFHSIEVVSGVDDEGNPLRERVYRRAADVYESVTDTDQVVDYYIGQSRSFAREANVTVKAARNQNNHYQRKLPFPELEDEGNVA